MRRARELLVDEYTCVRVTHVTNPDYTRTDTEVPVCSGLCRVKSFRAYEAVIMSGGRAVVQQRTEVQVMPGDGPFQVGDIFRVSGFDRPFRVAGLDDQSVQTLQHLLVDVITN